MQRTTFLLFCMFKLTLGSPLAFLLSRSQASIVKCQEFVEWISANRHAHEKYPKMPPFVLPFYSKLEKQLELMCDCAKLYAYKATAARGQTAEAETDGKSD
jgi:hypothetical protein